MGPRCSIILRILYFIPVLFIWSIIFWSYYVYNYALCFATISNTFQRVIYILLFHVAFVTFMYAYCQTIWTRHAPVPKTFHLHESECNELQRLKGNFPEYRQFLEHIVASRNLPLLTRDGQGCPRVCTSCRLIKPDRAHHCSTCNACILKMDHHCPWVDNCVGFSNYKFFVQFLLYGFLLCVYVWSTSLPYFIEAFNSHTSPFTYLRLHKIMGFMVAAVFSFALLCLGGYHIYLTAVNRTTLETFRKPQFTLPTKHGFYLGVVRNFKEVFGARWIDLFLPVATQLGNGVSFPISASRNSMLLSTSLHDEEANVGLLVSEGSREARDSLTDSLSQ